jgi:hypothetical protein
MAEADDPGLARLAGTIALLALLGTPLVAFIWETLNRVMAGWFDPVRIALSVPALIILYYVLRYVGHTAQRISS